MVSWVLAGLAAESMRKQHVAGEMARDQQEAAVREADRKSKNQEKRNEAMRVAEQMGKKTRQTKTVVKSPFANKKKKGTMRSQFTVGAGGGSGANY